ncbi:MAG: sigma-70 family RNA polymerase sigma factor [Odoribacteraceae bacterium]|jgi:RNA polymerase sigma-70 factor (ECF subfamily)|nr:sigma-70 family RNA polymerase sigma factor [Odoribacteraceae bacterium]
MQNQDEEICRLLRQRDKKGLEKLFTVYYRPLVTWADTFLEDMNGAEDLVQEFFVRLWEKKITEHLVASTLQSYLFISVKNMSFNILKRRDPLKNAGTIARVDRTWVEYDDLTERMLQEVESEIEKLPARSKEIIKAVYIDGLRYKEVAERYSITTATVKTLLVNALKQLRERADAMNHKLFLLFFKILAR